MEGITRPGHLPMLPLLSHDPILLISLHDMLTDIWPNNYWQHPKVVLNSTFLIWGYVLRMKWLNSDKHLTVTQTL